jgi:hypothetical protein
MASLGWGFHNFWISTTSRCELSVWFIVKKFSCKVRHKVLIGVAGLAAVCWALWLGWNEVVFQRTNPKPFFTSSSERHTGSEAGLFSLKRKRRRLSREVDICWKSTPRISSRGSDGTPWSAWSASCCRVLAVSQGWLPILWLFLLSKSICSLCVAGVVAYFVVVSSF